MIIKDRCVFSVLLNHSCMPPYSFYFLSFTVYALFHVNRNRIEALSKNTRSHIHSSPVQFRWKERPGNSLFSLLISVLSNLFSTHFSFIVRYHSWCCCCHLPINKINFVMRLSNRLVLIYDAFKLKLCVSINRHTHTYTYRYKFNHTQGNN